MNRFFSALVVCMLSVPSFVQAEEDDLVTQVVGAPVAQSEAHRLASIRLIENYLLPTYERLSFQMSLQAEAWQTVCPAPTKPQLEKLQQHYKNAAGMWARVEFIRFGPVSFLLRHERVSHWPERRNAVGRALNSLLATPDGESLAPKQFSRASVAVQGLPALERLLFTQGDKWEGPTDEAAIAWRCAVGQAIATNLATISREIVEGWKDAEGPLEQARAGKTTGLYYTDASDLGRRLLTDQLTGFQIMGDIKLAAPRGVALEEGQEPVAKSSKLEAWRSGLSKANLVANLYAMKGMTHAWGVTSTWSDAQRADVETAFQKADASFRALPTDMKAGLNEGTALASIEQALVDLRLLRTQVADVLPQSLELTLGFNALDGD